MKNYIACLYFSIRAKLLTPSPQSILLTKLDHYGIRDLSLKWFENYFKDRKQCVKLGDSTSSNAHLKYGIGPGYNPGTISLFNNHKMISLKSVNIVVL